MSKKETITVEMFKMWIEGIEEMQEDDWTPSPTQWKRIRQKIDMLEDEPVPVAVQPYGGGDPYRSMEAPYGNLMHGNHDTGQSNWNQSNVQQGPGVIGRAPDGNLIYDAPAPITPTSS